jgi:GNAT superfamily N-acetyltransferase
MVIPMREMTAESRWIGTIGKACQDDYALISEHLLRLDQESLYRRFGNLISNEFIARYIDQALSLQTIFFVCRVNGDVRGIAELRRLGLAEHEAEAAITVESPFRDLGIGTALMAAIVEEATRIGLREIFMCFDVRNHRMRRVAEKFHGRLFRGDGHCIAHISIKAEGRGGDGDRLRPRWAGRGQGALENIAKAFAGAASASFRALCRRSAIPGRRFAS